MSSSKPRNGKTSSQDYTNLLFSDSESDTVPDLRLPPLRGKKTKRRGLRRSSEESICSLWMVLRVVIVLVLLISIVTLGVITYWSLQQIRELKDQINTLENKNAKTPEEFQVFKSKLVTMNKTMTDLQTGKNGLDGLSKTVLGMQNQITALTATTTQLQKIVQSSESSSKENLAVANTVADLGSSVQSMKTDVDALKSSQTSLTTDIQELKNRVSVLENPGGREGGSSVNSPDMLEMLSQINATFTQNIATATADLGRQQSGLDAVDKFAQDLADRLQNVSQKITDLTHSQQLLQNLVSEQRKQPGGNNEEHSQTETLNSLTQLQDQVDRLQTLYEQMQSDHTNLTKMGKAAEGSAVSVSNNDIQALQKDHDDFVLFRSEVYQDISILNASLAVMNGTVNILNADVEHLFGKVTLVMSELSNVTTVVEGLTNLQLKQSEKAKEQSTHEGTAEHAGEKEPGEKTAATSTPAPRSIDGNKKSTTPSTELPEETEKNLNPEDQNKTHSKY